MNVYFSDILLKEISPSCKLVYNKTDKTKYQLKLINVRCPFGPEEFQNKIYLNVELKKDEYDHQVLLKDIKLIETFLLKDTNMEKTSNLTVGQIYASQATWEKPLKNHWNQICAFTITIIVSRQKMLLQKNFIEWQKRATCFGLIKIGDMRAKRQLLKHS